MAMRYTDLEPGRREPATHRLKDISVGGMEEDVLPVDDNSRSPSPRKELDLEDDKDDDGDVDAYQAVYTGIVDDEE